MVSKNNIHSVFIVVQEFVVKRGRVCRYLNGQIYLRRFSPPIFTP